MQFLNGKTIPRRTFLRGMGATLALPYLDAMTPAFSRFGRNGGAAATDGTRVIFIEQVHGAAGSNAFGASKNLWAPAGVGRNFELVGDNALTGLDPWRKYLTIVSNTDVRMAEAFAPPEIGGDHFRSSATFLTQSHPKQTQGGDVRAGVSIDQLYAQRFGQDTPIPSMQLCIEKVDQAGGCGYGYSCVYTDAISWAAPDRPLPMIRDPRVVFDELFGVLETGATAAGRAARLAEDRSILDWILAAAARLRTTLGAGDRARLADYLDQVREIERRIQIVEAQNRSGEVRELPEAPAGVPDSFSEHVRMMFDLQLLAFASDVTRVFAFKLGRDASSRTYPESGFRGPFHETSHHGGRESKILEFARLNAFHVGLIPYFLERLKNTPDGDGTLLDHTLLLYGSPMGDSNLHNHKRVPFFMVGGAGGAVPGGRHLKAPNGTPLANVMLAVLQALGVTDLEQFGDSDGVFDLGAG